MNTYTAKMIAIDGSDKIRYKMVITTPKINVGDMVYVGIYGGFIGRTDHICSKIDEAPSHLPKGLMCYTEDGYYEYLKDCYRVVGEVSPSAVWVHDGLEIAEKDLSYKESDDFLVERLRLKFEEKTGFKIGSWVKDSEDGYKTRYQGQIFDYKLRGTSLAVMFGSNIGRGSMCCGHADEILAMREEEIKFHEGCGMESTYRKPIIKVNCPTCNTFH